MSIDDLYIELSNNYDLRLITSEKNTVSLDNLVGWKLVGTLKGYSYNSINCIFETGSSMWLGRFDIAIVTPEPTMISANKFIFVSPQCPDIYLLEDFSGIFNDIKSDIEKFIRNSPILSVNNIGEGDLVIQNDGTISTTAPNGWYDFTNYVSPIPPFINPVGYSDNGNWCCNNTNIIK